MLLDLAALEVVDAINRKGSFAAAAKELDRVPSAITYVVRKLEDDLGVLLFDRSGHRAQLTPAGAELLSEGRVLMQGADDLERRVRRVASGWEVELRIAVDGILRMDAVLKLVKEFLSGESLTRIRLSSEVLAGTWDALLSGRADLALGTPAILPGMGDAPGIRTQELGTFEMVFALAPDHPLAQLPEPLTATQIGAHRAIAVADTSRSQPAVTVGLLRGQDVLTVPTLSDKIAAQVAGLGCGYVPRARIARELKAGQLLLRETADTLCKRPLNYSFRADARGKAMGWFLNRLEDPLVRQSLLP